MKVKDRVKSFNTNNWDYWEEFQHNVKYINDYTTFFLNEFSKDDCMLNDEYVLEKLNLIESNVKNLKFLITRKKD